ncbi:DNA glycosylase AlkZ-like family protein [Streptomyces sp. NPDC048496]|uniref:DNA glycosylase AlkZ-like family protein n=1 Tax=Streptomyces sp. NPDC048496 TaxID=3365558 RepID=UPI00371AB1CF
MEELPGSPGARDVRMLPAYDNYLVGYRTRELSVPAAHLGRVWPGGGVIRPTVVADGLTIGTWARRDADRVVQVDAFAPLSTQVQVLVDAEASAVSAFCSPPPERAGASR